MPPVLKSKWPDVAQQQTIALVGNPNCGKTSLFNALTGLRQRVANFPGITIEKKIGYFREAGAEYKMVDLPGTYSLFPKSQDEAIPLELLLDDKADDYPDKLVCVADASNFKRNALLLTQAADLGLPVVLCVNMVDEAERQGIQIDAAAIERHTGIPTVLTNARKGDGIRELKQRIAEPFLVTNEHYVSPEIKHLFNGQANSTAVGAYRQYLREQPLFRERFEVHYTARPEGQKVTIGGQDLGEVRRQDILHRYRRINEVFAPHIRKNEQARKDLSARLDRITTHPVFGYLIFLGLMLFIFQSIFSFAEAPMNAIDAGFAWVNGSLDGLLPDGPLKALLLDGVLAGLNGVLVFIPQIAILFFLISILEDTGYLSRVALLMDRIMRHFGMSGKSVLPLMSGFACAIPAIMATRNIESWRDRMITIMVTPLMSCSARIPVFILLIGLAVPDQTLWGFFNLQGVAMVGLYLLGFFTALFAAWVFKKGLKVRERKTFVMEMPPYRLPNFRNVLFTMWEKVKTFTFEAGKIIVAISIVLWVLASYGPDRSGAWWNPEPRYGAEAMDFGENASARLRSSYAGHLGRGFEPVIAPLGFDWKIGIGLLTSFAAREVFVGTMATLYGMQGDESDFRQLKQAMLREKDPDTGQPIFSLATVVSLMIFFTYAMQCMSTLAITYRETNSAKWPLIQLAYMTLLAYGASFVVYQALA